MKKKKSMAYIEVVVAMVDFGILLDFVDKKSLRWKAETPGRAKGQNLRLDVWQLRFDL